MCMYTKTLVVVMMLCVLSLYSEIKNSSSQLSVALCVYTIVEHCDLLNMHAD